VGFNDRVEKVPAGLFEVHQTFVFRFEDGDDGGVALLLPAGPPELLRGRVLFRVFWLGEVVLAESFNEFLDPGSGVGGGFDSRDVVVNDGYGFAAHETVAESI
jgi:hypothetical protein